MSRDALIVGINRYKHLKMQLSAPAVDAEEMRKFLKKYGQFNVLTPLLL
jgi:hypothetical protein